MAYYDNILVLGISPNGLSYFEITDYLFRWQEKKVAKYLTGQNGCIYKTIQNYKPTYLLRKGILLDDHLSIF